MAGQGFGERDNAISRIRQYTTDEHETFAYTELDLCTCGPKTRAEWGCDCGALDEPIYRKKDEKSFYFFETLLDEAHPSSKLFYDYLLEAALLHAQKQRDYGRTDDPFSNVRASEEWGIEGWIGACVRLNDKVRRLQALATKGELANEAVIDSFMDICVYALIARVLYEQDLNS